MMGPVAILAAVAFIVFLVALFPPGEKYPLVAVGGLILSVAVFLAGSG